MEEFQLPTFVQAKSSSGFKCTDKLTEHGDHHALFVKTENTHVCENMLSNWDSKLLSLRTK